MNNDIAKDAAELCPFCGSQFTFQSSNGAASCFMECNECGASGPVCSNYEYALAAWNTRATAADKERIAELEAKLVALGDLAVADWNDEIVGAVDATVNEPTRYKDVLRRLFTEIPAQLAAKTQECEGLRQVIAKRPYCRNCNFPSVSLGEVVIDLNTGELLAPDSARKEGE